MIRLFTDMDAELQDLKKRINDIARTADQPCVGCEALERRVAELERRLDMDTGVQALEAALELEDPTGAVVGLLYPTEEPDAIDVLLQEAQRMGSGIFDEDIEELLAGDLQSMGDECQPVSAAHVAPSGPTTEEAPMEEMEDIKVTVTVSRCHLILGDSLAKHLDLPVTPQDSVINLAESGNTWAREAHHIRDHIKEWKAEVTEKGASCGSISILMGGNEIYGRSGMPPQGLDREAVKEILGELTPQGQVTMAGPTIRLWKGEGKCGRTRQLSRPTGSSEK